jgi:hypothetical protein
MQQRPTSTPSFGVNLLLGAVLGAVGLFNLFAGSTGEGIGVVLKGLAMTAYAALLLRDALHIRKTGLPAMTRKRMNAIGLGCLALYVLGVLVKRGPELAQMVN